MPLWEIQQKLKVNKDLFNKHGNFRYRSAEVILEAVKPLLKNGETLILNDEIVSMGDRYYVKAIATFTDENGKVVEVSAFAREPEERKGMDAAQITGASSSYARKYALQGLFILDDGQDADSLPNSPNTTVDISKLITKVKNLATQKGVAEIDIVKAYNKEGGNYKKIDDMPEDVLLNIIKQLNTKPNKE